MVYQLPRLTLLLVLKQNRRTVFLKEVFKTAGTHMI